MRLTSMGNAVAKTPNEADDVSEVREGGGAEEFHC